MKPKARCTRRRLLDKTLADFRRQGAQLAWPTKKSSRTSIASSASSPPLFAERARCTNAFELVLEDESRLSGLPDSARSMAVKPRRQRQDRLRFTCSTERHRRAHLPDDAALREAIWTAFNAAPPAVSTTIAASSQLLELRRRAQLLGFKHFADLVTTIAWQRRQSQRFIADLTEKSRGAFEREKLELAEFAKSLGAALRSNRGTSATTSRSCARLASNWTKRSCWLLPAERRCKAPSKSRSACTA